LLEILKTVNIVVRPVLIKRVESGEIDINALDMNQLQTICNLTLIHRNMALKYSIAHNREILSGLVKGLRLVVEMGQTFYGELIRLLE
jgi:hypothetical protein